MGFLSEKYLSGKCYVKEGKRLTLRQGLRQGTKMRKPCKYKVFIVARGQTRPSSFWYTRITRITYNCMRMQRRTRIDAMGRKVIKAFPTACCQIEMSLPRAHSHKHLNMILETNDDERLIGSRNGIFIEKCLWMKSYVARGRRLTLRQSAQQFRATRTTWELEILLAARGQTRPSWVCYSCIQIKCHSETEQAIVGECKTHDGTTWSEKL